MLAVGDLKSPLPFGAYMTPSPVGAYMTIDAPSFKPFTRLQG